MTQDAFTTIVRGFEVTLEAGETDDVYTVHVVEGSGVPWTVEIPVNLDNFEGDNDDLDGSNELLNFVAGAAVDLFESSRNTLGQGAGALEVTAMKRAQCCGVTGCGAGWQNYYLQLKDTPFETQAIELIKQLLAVQMEEPEDPTVGLRKEKLQLEHELNLLELELLQNSPEQQTIIIVGGRKQAYFDVDIPLYLDLFAGSPQEQQAMSVIKELLDIQEKINQSEENSPWNAKWNKEQAVELQLQELVVESIQQNAMPAQTGMDSAPNMANDIAELMEGVDLHAPMASKRAQQIRTEGMWDYTEEFQMSNPIVAGRPVRLRKPHDESWLEAARHSMCVMEVLDPKMGEQKGRGQGSGWMDLQTIRTDDIDYLPPEYVALFDSEMPSSIFDEDAADPAFKTSRRAFEEFETAEDRETEGGEIRHDLDTGCIDPEDYKFEPNQKVTLNKKLELMIGGGVPQNYDKGTPCVVESRYDGQGDMYYVRFEDGQMARVLFSDLTGGGKKKESYRTYMEDLLKTAYDRRRDTSKWYDSLDTGKQIAYINLNVDDEEEVPPEVRDFMDVSEDGELSIAVPFSWGVCDTCEGRRKVVNPSIDEHGISPEEFQEDPDFEESYHSGEYDITCPGCGGDGLVPEPNYGNNAALKNFVESMLQEKSRYEREWRHEQEMGY